MAAGDIREQIVTYLTDVHGTEETPPRGCGQAWTPSTTNSSAAAPDTTGKVAIQAFATEHLEIASYRSLRAVAEQAGDVETVAMCER